MTTLQKRIQAQVTKGQVSITEKTGEKRCLAASRRTSLQHPELWTGAVGAPGTEIEATEGPSGTLSSFPPHGQASLRRAGWVGGHLRPRRQVWGRRGTLPCQGPWASSRPASLRLQRNDVPKDS